jgi:formylglycine-generating enzyme required for sulfatase activity
LRGSHGLTFLLDTAVCHISFFEADAFARWRGCRLPTEAEWELVASQEPRTGNFLDTGRLHPAAATGEGIDQLFGDCWEWTASPYTAYPGYKPLPGALGEYDGKFTSTQMILRGGLALPLLITCAQPIGTSFNPQCVGNSLEHVWRSEMTCPPRLQFLS